MATSWPTVDAYTFDLTERLRDASSSSLAQFEQSISRDYEWLDDYLDNIEAQGRRAPIAELMKTPSRTATVKKTRAMATANKNRAEQIRQFNLALSPLTKSPAGRIPFSPLHVQGNNSVPASPTRAAAKGKGKALAPLKEDVEEKPAPKKRGRPKKNADKENADKENAGTDAPSRSTRSASSKSTRSKKGKAKAVDPEPEPIVEPEPAVQTEAELAAVEDVPMIEGEPEPEPAAKEFPTLVPAQEEVIPSKELETSVEHMAVDDSFVTIALDSVPSRPTEEQQPDEAMDVDDLAPIVDLTSAHTSPIKQASPAKQPSPIKQATSAKPLSPVKKTPSPIKAASPVKEASPVKVASTVQPSSPVKASSPVKPSSPVKESSPVKASSPVKEASPVKPAVPTRQVRSSWLSQALGTNQVPINSAHRMSTQFDPMRKSQMASSTNKRKSEAAEDEEKESKRADKVARFNSTAATDAASGLPVSPKKQSQFGSSRAPASATSLPQASVSTPATAGTRLAATSVPQAQEGRMSKLQEMKERTAAAAAARQQEKAAAAAAAVSEDAAPAAANNGGFLRGLGGFLRSAAPSKAELERDAQQEAERELNRVLQELAEQDKKAEEAKLAKEMEAAQALESDLYEEDFGDRAIVLSDDSAEEFEVNDSVTLPSLPGDDSFLEDDEDDPMEGTALSALAAAGIKVNVSTTPKHTPPRKPSRIAKAVASPSPMKSRMKAPTILVSPPPKSRPATGKPVRTNALPRAISPSSAIDSEADDEDDEPHQKTRKGNSSRSTTNTSLASSTNTLNQTERMAGKVLGVKPTPNRVKSVQAAEAAAKKEAADKERRLKARQELERKKVEAKRRQEEAERAAAEEERKQRLADEEERRKKLAHNDKIRRAKMEKAEQLKKQREAEAARVAEEEAAAAAAKRKAASGLTRSVSSSNLTKSTASSLNKVAAPKTPATAGMKRMGPTPNQGKEPLHPCKVSKVVPSAFRTETEPSATIKAVPQRPTLGPPSRTSAYASSSAAGPSRPSASTAAPVRTQTHAATLQAQRATLQAQLDQKALDAESEQIVLPDINSEYSDSDDSDRETDFKRPAWAESPELKSALEAQASVNPDELFGPIRPLSMEELFNARVGKFRNRTSSANWSGADRLTEAEEREYARRMGFRPINAPREGGQ